MKTSYVAFLLLGMAARFSGACSVTSCIQGSGLTCDVYETQKTCLAAEKEKCGSSDAMSEAAIEAQITIVDTAIAALNAAGTNCGACSLTSCIQGVGATCDVYETQKNCLIAEKEKCGSSDTTAIDAQITIVDGLIAGLNALGTECGSCSLTSCIQGIGATCDVYTTQKTCLVAEKKKCGSSDTTAIDAQITIVDALIAGLNAIGTECGSAAISASVTVLIVGVLVAIFKE